MKILALVSKMKPEKRCVFSPGDHRGARPKRCSAKLCQPISNIITQKFWQGIADWDKQNCCAAGLAFSVTNSTYCKLKCYLGKTILYRILILYPLFVQLQTVNPDISCHLRTAETLVGRLFAFGRVKILIGFKRCKTKNLVVLIDFHRLCSY